MGLFMREGGDGDDGGVEVGVLSAIADGAVARWPQLRLSAELQVAKASQFRRDI